MRHGYPKAAMFALLLLSVTASAFPASQPAAKPRIASPAKLGRPTPIVISNPAAARPAPILPKSANRPLAKPAPVSGKPFAPPASPVLRSSLGNPASSAVPVRKASPSAGPAEVETPVPAADDPNRERILALQEALTHIVHGTVLGRLHVGMRVLDLADGHVLFSRRGSVLMDPASNQKVLATATALLRLGSTWRFRTELSGPPPDGDGTIAGDLISAGQWRSFAARHAHRGHGRGSGPPGCQRVSRAACWAIRGASVLTRPSSRAARRYGWAGRPLKCACGRATRSAPMPSPPCGLATMPCDW